MSGFVGVVEEGIEDLPADTAQCFEMHVHGGIFRLRFCEWTCSWMRCFEEDIVDREVGIYKDAKRFT